VEFDLGILGGGQLARMSVLAAHPMGLRPLCLCSERDDPAAQVGESLIAHKDDPQAISALFERCEVVTLESEFVSAQAIRAAKSFDPSRMIPTLAALEIIQDKLTQRQTLAAAGVPSPRAVAIEGQGEQAIAAIGFPMVLKARFGGYDGKGTRYAKTEQEFLSLEPDWGKGGWLAESFVPFQRELAVMVFVQNGRAGAFPTMETVQKDHICDLVFPCTSDAAQVAIQAVQAVGGDGLFGVELFELKNGQVLVNEMAPRPHNSGHYTLDWGGPSQFQQHVRVVCGLAPAPATGHPTCMANLMGRPNARDHRNGLRQALKTEPAAAVHWYGKNESRKGRKMGHLNLRANENEPTESLVARTVAAREAFYSGWQQ